MRCLVLICGVFSAVAIAEDRFYPTFDAQGRVQVIKSETGQSENVDATKKNTLSIDRTLAQPSLSLQKVAPEQSPLKQGVRQVDAETYIDAELLEQKNFNIDDKKRFYYLPNVGLGSHVVESKEGAVSLAIAQPNTVKPMAYVSSNYQWVSKEEVQSWYPQSTECVNALILKKKSRSFKEVNDIWVQPSLTPNAIEMDSILSLPLTMPSKQLRLLSYANTYKKPTFYVPVVLFLDEKGCTLSAVWQYWSRAHAATDSQYASVDGLVNVPEQSRYVVFYRPTQKLQADIPLSPESGSFVVEAY